LFVFIHDRFSGFLIRFSFFSTENHNRRRTDTPQAEPPMLPHGARHHHAYR